MNTQTHTSHLRQRFPLLVTYVNELLDLAHNPNTIDNERYARKARALAKACANTTLARETSPEATQVLTLFVGLHRRLDWDAPVAINAHLIANTLDAADLICATASLDDCTCVSDPSLLCFSEDHLTKADISATYGKMATTARI